MTEKERVEAVYRESGLMMDPDKAVIYWEKELIMIDEYFYVMMAYNFPNLFGPSR